jgi:hypothetical protein
LRQVVQGQKLWRTEIVVHAALVFPGRRLKRREQMRLAGGGPVASREIVIETMTSKLRQAKIGPHHNQLEVFILPNVIRVAGPTFLATGKTGGRSQFESAAPFEKLFRYLAAFRAIDSRVAAEGKSFIEEAARLRDGQIFCDS